MKNYEFKIAGLGTMIGNREELDRAYEIYGFKNVFVLKSWTC